MSASVRSHHTDPVPAPPVSAPPRRRRARRLAIAGLLVAGAGAGMVAVAVGQDSTGAGVSAPSVSAPSTSIAGAGGAPSTAEVDPTAPLPKSRARLVSPVAGEATQATGERSQAAAAARSAKDDMTLPRPKGPATVSGNRSGAAPSVHDLQVDKATALPNGVALPPLEAPEAVMEVIRAGNTIARSPYKWGGGHGRFLDNGYDCSGSVSFALYAAGLIEGPRTSGQLESWGEPGKGRWITVYANGGHTFMEVAGIRFDTSAQRVTGSRWENEMRPTAGFAVRHPPGL
jgi:cell wall-associated NlpC family hydrolase